MAEQTPIPADGIRDVPPEVLAMADKTLLRIHELIDGAPLALVVHAYRAGLAAGRTDALRSVAEMFDALPPCPTYLDCTAGGEPHDRHETAGATLLRLADEMEATGRG